jgi:hypothetical protein
MSGLMDGWIVRDINGGERRFAAAGVLGFEAFAFIGCDWA